MVQMVELSAKPREISALESVSLIIN